MFGRGSKVFLICKLKNELWERLGNEKNYNMNSKL